LNGGQRSSRHHLSINFINGVFEVQVLLLLLPAAEVEKLRRRTAKQTTRRSRGWI
jgi:hypothetical protein